MDTHDDYVTAFYLEARAVRARQLQVVERTGRTSAVMFVNLDASAGIAIADRHARFKMSLEVADDSTGFVAFAGADEKCRVSFGLPVDDQPAVKLSGPSGTLRACLYIEEGRPALTAYQENEIQRFALYLDESGKPYIDLSNAHEPYRAGLTTGIEEAGGLSEISRSTAESEVTVTGGGVPGTAPEAS